MDDDQDPITIGPDFFLGGYFSKDCPFTRDWLLSFTARTSKKEIHKLRVAGGGRFH